MMDIEARKLGKKAIVRTLEPYDFHRVTDLLVEVW
jgi:hypothetical protein